LPARPPMQGAGYGPPPHRHENMVLAVGDNAVTYYQQSLYKAKPTCPHPATMTGHRQPEFAIGKVLGPLICKPDFNLSAIWDISNLACKISMKKDHL